MKITGVENYSNTEGNQPTAIPDIPLNTTQLIVRHGKIKGHPNPSPISIFMLFSWESFHYTSLVLQLKTSKYVLYRRIYTTSNICGRFLSISVGNYLL